MARMPYGRIGGTGSSWDPRGASHWSRSGNSEKLSTAEYQLPIVICFFYAASDIVDHAHQPRLKFRMLNGSFILDS